MLIKITKCEIFGSDDARGITENKITKQMISMMENNLIGFDE